MVVLINIYRNQQDQHIFIIWIQIIVFNFKRWTKNDIVLVFVCIINLYMCLEVGMIVQGIQFYQVVKSNIDDWYRFDI